MLMLTIHRGGGGGGGGRTTRLRCTAKKNADSKIAVCKIADGQKSPIY